MKTSRKMSIWRLLAVMLLSLGVLAPLATGQDDIPANTTDIETSIPDGEALLPLQNWVPLFRVNMAWSAEDAPAPRTLAYLDFTITGDRFPDDRTWWRFGAAESKHLYELALIREIVIPDVIEAGTLDENDQVLYVWTPDGMAGDIQLGTVTDSQGSIRYQMDFSGAARRGGDPLSDLGINPATSLHYPVDFPLPNSAVGESYFLCVRTSSQWFSGLSLGVTVNAAQVIPKFPTEDGFVDTLNPEILSEVGQDVGYSSSFSVYDVTGSLNSGSYGEQYTNTWNWPARQYTPFPEYYRPRWDRTTPSLDMVTGEFIQLRRLFSIETWTAAIGINIHGTSASVLEAEQRERDAGPVGLPESQPWPRNRPGIPTTGDLPPRVDVFPVGAPHIIEANVVARDIGADPFGTPGNGGFNPTEGLEFMTPNLSGDGSGIDVTYADGRDSAFNGLWLWHDSNNNYIFDQPTPGTRGVTFNDNPALAFPMYVGVENGDENPYLGSTPFIPSLFDNNMDTYWQHVPFPSDGGDPWWKIKLTLGNIRETGGGRFEAQPDGDINSWPNQYYCDYFITIRPDSGYQDISGQPGDGTGINLGADTQIMLEPRDPDSPFTSGILATSQIPMEYPYVYATFMKPLTWQEHPGLEVVNPSQDHDYEPWWPQRTMNFHNTKPIGSGVDVHDLVLLYEGDSDYVTWSNYDFINGNDGFGIPLEITDTTDFDRWMDLRGDLQKTFADGYSVGVNYWGITNIPWDNMQIAQPFESVPFFSVWDTATGNPRSSWFPNPPAQPNRLSYGSWLPFLNQQPLEHGVYPHAPLRFPWAGDVDQWNVATNMQARMLRQRIELNSSATAMLGINVCGVNDSFVNSLAPVKVQQITVAFWGPDYDGDGKTDFQPGDLRELDPDGVAGDSGVVLCRDNGDGVFLDPILDTPLALNNLAWGKAPEPVDLDGDKIADDLNGDGVVTTADYAWVLRLTPDVPWMAPIEDVTAGTSSGGGEGGGEGGGGGGITPPGVLGSAADLAKPGEVRAVPALNVAGANAGLLPANTINLDETPGAGNPGDDLFVAVRTSDTISRFDRFRAFIPAWLPSRPAYDRVGGIQFAPQNYAATTGFEKTHPEEIAGVDGYFYHDLIEANIGVVIDDFTGPNQTLRTNGTPLAVLGLDISTNRGSKGVAASGKTGTGSPSQFLATGLNFAPGALAKYFLIDANYEAYEITGNQGNTLTLLSGTPASGPWYIARDPSFLEQIIVEFYDGLGNTGFNITRDLLPLTLDDKGTCLPSGVAIYRDNDNDPRNTNGAFDPDVDIPLRLDYPPFMTGVAGEPDTQVMFVFSSPGTDNIYKGVGANLTEQPRYRQVIPETFGSQSASNADFGSDFFVVVRAAGEIAEDRAFRAAIVSWGPNTPTEPDPDTFPPPPIGQQGEFDLFSEFPWGARALGFVTFFKDIRANYDPFEYSGYSWLRTSANIEEVTNNVTILTPVAQPGDVIISSVSHEVLPATIPADGLTIIIRGAGFGIRPIVDINRNALKVVSANNTIITAKLEGGTVLTEPVVLTVRNPISGKFATWTSITLSDEDWAEAPIITSLTPKRGTASDFPVNIYGARFQEPEVTFGETKMPIVEWSPTRIVVNYPSFGLPVTGAMDVVVRNTATELFATKTSGFTFVNPPEGGGIGGIVRPCFIATAAYGSPMDADLGVLRGFRDGVLLKSAAGAAFVDWYYGVSPLMADWLVGHPVWAVVVRTVLVPMVWVARYPALMLGLAVALWVMRRRMSARCASS